MPYPNIPANDGQWFRLYELFGDQTGSRLMLDVMRATHPEIPDVVMARLLGMDSRGYARYVSAAPDLLCGDPDERILSGLARIAGLLGKPENVKSEMEALKAVTRPAYANYLGMQTLLDRYASIPEWYGEYDRFQPLLEETFPEYRGREHDEAKRLLHSAIVCHAGIVRGYLRHLPAMAAMAIEPKDMLQVLNAVAYLSYRAAFDDDMVSAMHLTMDMERPGSETWKAFHEALHIRPKPDAQGH